MFAAFFLGLFGSVGHCVGMCSGVAILLGRTGQARGWRVILLHAGRLTTYALLGAAAGALGYALAGMAQYNVMGEHLHKRLEWPGLQWLQGLMALLAAAMALYFAMALLGRAPSPELLLTRVTHWWGRTVRQMRARESRGEDEAARGGLRGLWTIYALGLLWGLLPCGLVLTALLLAAVTATPTLGATTMLLFGLGTLPMTLGMSVAPRVPALRMRAGAWTRPLTAGIVLLFGLQMALRGLAAWGVIPHSNLGGLALW